MPVKKNASDLPYNSVAEKAVLGSAMVSNSALFNVLSALEESDFFEVIGEVKKQTIIVTKSFLLDGKNGESILDMKRIQNVKGKKYRIEKLRPFDDKNLATIQTTITSLS